MNRLCSCAASAVLAVASSASAQIVASDSASNYLLGGWGHGSNGGTGFGAWQISVSDGGFAGGFIGDPASAGISGMAPNSFGLYANPAGSGASVTATRAFGSTLGVGDSFSLQWGVNWDGDNGDSGVKGFRVRIGSTDVITVQQAGFPGDITVNGVNTSFGYGVQAMTWTFTQVSGTMVSVTANDRDGTGTFSSSIAVSGFLSGFSLYAAQLAPGDNRQPYYNSFTITAIPAPGALVLIGVASLAGARRRR